jgi:hypothetical protein
VGGGGKAGIPSTSAPAGSDYESLPGGGEVVDLFAGLVVVNDGSYRHRQLHATAVAAGAITTFAVASALCGVLGIEAKMEKGIVVLACDQLHIAAAPSVSTAWTASRHKLFTPECRTPVTSVAGLHGDNYFIDKHEET